MTFVNTVVKAAGKAVQLSEDLESMFDGNKTKLVRFVRKLASEFGENTSIADVYKKVAGFAAPTKTFDGVTYAAGNSWPYLTDEGDYTASLLDVVEADGKVKLLFGFEYNGTARYLYQTLDDVSAVKAIRYTKSIRTSYDISVAHDYVKAIDEYKAIVADSEQTYNG